MANVSLKSVSKVFPPDVKAVQDVSLNIDDKEFVVLVGPSGCGKSTTLRMIAGLEEITQGEIYIEDKLVNDVPPKDRDIAMVFQNYALYPHMTVYKNMAFGLMLRKYPKSEIEQRVKDAAEILGITELLDRKPKALSGGQRQRVAVGRAIVRKPKVFLFDEPLSNLDAKMRVQMRTELTKLHLRLQSTMIYVTHDQVEAMTMGDRIVVMKDGIVHQVADPIGLYDKPVNKFVAGFIGSPAMNFIDGILVQKNGAIYFNEGKDAKFEVKLPEKFYSALTNYVGKEVTFGVRPEDFADISYASFAKPENTITAKVEIVEPMGSELYVYLTTGKTPFIARVEPHLQVEIDQMRSLALNMDKTHVFDKQTEKTIV